jgi:hypothetical protein
MQHSLLLYNDYHFSAARTAPSLQRTDEGAMHHRRVTANPIAHTAPQAVPGETEVAPQILLDDVVPILSELARHLGYAHQLGEELAKLRSSSLRNAKTLGVAPGEAMPCPGSLRLGFRPQHRPGQ